MIMAASSLLVMKGDLQHFDGIRCSTDSRVTASGCADSALLETGELFVVERTTAVRAGVEVSK
jgi:hypothetical protein